MRCPACGVDVLEQAVYCHKCGERVSPGSDNPHPADESHNSANTFNSSSAQLGLRNPPEEELWRGGYSPKAMTASWLVGGLLSVLFLAAGVYLARTALWWLIVVVSMIVPWVYFYAILCYRRVSDRYSLTTQRFIHEHGIFRRVSDRIETLDIDDIAFEQGLLERLMGVGTIRITSTDRSHPSLALPGIDNIAAVTAIFDNARLAERRRRGLHVEQI